MLSPGRALILNSDSGRELPKVHGLEALYSRGCTPRHGEVIMIAGRSGTQKSGFALWWTCQMNLPTLYFSADMSAFTASTRVAAMQTGYTTSAIEKLMHIDGDERDKILHSMDHLNVQFAFGKITWRGLDAELEAYVELHNRYPEVIVIDNLMDVENASADYQAQMETMDELTTLARNTGATVLILHHASDKSWEAKSDPWAPPSRDQVKGGLSEKPELSLSVALNPKSHEYHIAVIKQRMGPSDPTARSYATIRCEPELTRFSRYDYGNHIEGIKEAA